jgi:hypothetical protein
MKIIHSYIFFFIALFLFSFGQEAAAQSDKNIAGTWESVFRKGKQNCDLDYILDFKLDGKASAIVGSRFSECKSYTMDAPKWEVTKKEGELNGKTKKWNVISLSGPEGSKDIIVEVFEGDYMKIHMEVRDGDTTTIRKFIMKKIE